MVPIIIEQTVNAGIDAVWQAITDRNKMKQWYFDIPAFKPEVGIRFQFTGGDETTQYVHLCVITQVVPGKKLCHTWTYEGYAGESEVCFVLTPEGNNTNVKLIHTGVETFPSSNTAFKRGNFIEGWNHIIGKSLKEFVEKSGN